MNQRVDVLSQARQIYSQALQTCDSYRRMVRALGQPNARMLGLLEQELQQEGLSSAKTSFLRKQREDLSKPGIIQVIERYEDFLSDKLKNINSKYL